MRKVLSTIRRLRSSKGHPRRDISRHCPALLSSQKIGQYAARLGFDWNNTDEVFLKVQEELQELEESLKYGKRSRIEEEIGDLLFSIAQLCRKSKAEAELILHRANSKFIKRFKHLEIIAKREGRSSLKGMSVHELDKLWKKAKKSAARK